ncbi:hypothetical protein [Bradyrhizobium commune]|uniref:Uncharacterized protein n=1 Tax=Bradyrhizobium commune TaxID=83627 RepID=A0A7S9GY15_9BRAD|nr:hypothetical protein [Bradyrhizobium commune]QPF90450.1 hypothetical protein IC761_28725 [Bradyrhizobium commune]
MLTLSGASSAAASAARGRHVRFYWSLLVAIALVGPLPVTASIAGADPADPAAKVARTGYRSVIAPYSRLRPATPASWRERNGAVTPQPKQDK